MDAEIQARVPDLCVPTQPRRVHEGRTRARHLGPRKRNTRTSGLLSCPDYTTEHVFCLWFMEPDKPVSQVHSRQTYLPTTSLPSVSALPHPRVPSTEIHLGHLPSPSRFDNYPNMWYKIYDSLREHVLHDVLRPTKLQALFA